MSETQKQLGGETDWKPIEEAIRQAIKSEKASVRTSIPGEIVAYKQPKQKATVRLANNLRRENPETGEIETYEVPPIKNCPVAFPSGGGFSITWPLDRGDPVYIHFSMQSIDSWLNDGGTGNDPIDPRRFDLTDAVVYPGVRSFANALGSNAVNTAAMVLAGTAIHLGSAQPTDWVARADKVLSELQSIATPLNKWVEKFNSAVSSAQSWGSPQPVKATPNDSQLQTYSASKPKSSKVKTD